MIPIILLIVFLVTGIVNSGSDGQSGQSIIDKINKSDSNQALLVGTVATSLCMIPLYQLQFVKDGMLKLPTISLVKKLWVKYCYPPTTLEEDSYFPRQLMTMQDFKISFVVGISRVSSFFAVLALAWSIALVTSQIGCDRFFAAYIFTQFDIRVLPTFAYVVSCLMSLATGTSFGKN